MLPIEQLTLLWTADSTYSFTRFSWLVWQDKEDEEFAIVFAAMGVNMETAHFFKQVHLSAQPLHPLVLRLEKL